MKLIENIKNKAEEILKYQGFQRYARNTGWLFLEQVLRLIAGFLVGVWVVRYLGPGKFGIFSYALAFVAILGGIAKLGLDEIVVRDLVKEPEKRDIYLRTAFWLKFVGAFITLGIIGIATLFTSNDFTTNLYILIIASGIIFQSFEVIDFYFQSRVLAKFVSICKMIQLFISSLLKIYFVLIGADLFWFVLVCLIDQGLLAVSLYLSYRLQGLPSFFRYFDLAVGKRLLKNSWPLILSSIGVMIYMRIDQVMIKEMLDEKQVGLYSAAVRLCEVWYFIPMVITNSLFPAIVNAKKVSKELYYKRLQRLYTLMVWMAIGIALPATFLSSQIINFLYGKAYMESGKVLMIYIWAGVFVFFGCVKGKWIVTENMQTYGLICTSIGAISNIFLNIFLIKSFGIEGAAIATFISYGISSIIVSLFYSKDRVSSLMFLKSFSIRSIRSS